MTELEMVAKLLGRRLGRLRTNRERRKRHKRLYGTDKLPPRGTGLLRRLRRKRRKNAK